MKVKFFILLFLGTFFVQCRKDNTSQPVSVAVPFSATPYSIKYPFFWSKVPILNPANNSLTVEGIALGRKLFYDPILSQNNTQSCSSCHKQNFAFSDTSAFSLGDAGQIGKRNAPPIFNLGWFTNYGVLTHQFFWDGGAADLESQVYGPITNPIEMNETLLNVINKLKNNSAYPPLFKKAFGTDTITSQLLAFAISQFERTIISGNTKFDQGRLINFSNFSTEEMNGFITFTSERGDCWHCHTLAPPSSQVETDFGLDFSFHNNGLQKIFADSGLARITKNVGDMGKFKTPTIRNLVFTAPYMHDGRFSTLEQVVDFYDAQAYQGSNVDGFITKNPHPTGLNLSSQEKRELILFLKTLTDSSLIVNTSYLKP